MNRTAKQPFIIALTNRIKAINSRYGGCLDYSLFDEPSAISITATTCLKEADLVNYVQISLPRIFYTLISAGSCDIRRYAAFVFSGKFPAHFNDKVKDMSHYQSLLKVALWNSLGALGACGGDKTGSDPTSKNTYAAEIQVDVLDNGVEISGPAIFFEGQSAQIQFSGSQHQVLVGSAHLLGNNFGFSEFQLVPQLVGMGEHEQVTTRLTLNYGTTEQFVHDGWSRPVYQYPIELGDPITLKGGSDTILSAVLSDSFLDSDKDDFERFSWKQTEGPELGLTGADGADLTLKLPQVSDITRLRFQLSARSIKGKVFRREKIVFVVPDAAWLEATHIDQGADNALVAREDGSIVHMSFQGELQYTSSPFADLRQLENSDAGLWALAETGELSWNNGSGWQSPLQDLPGMAKLFGVFSDARSGTQMIDQSGNAYLVSGSTHDLSAPTSQVLSVSHRYIGEHFLLESGEIVTKAGEVVADNIDEIANHAFRQNDGRIGVYSNDEQLLFLEEFDQYNDIVAIAAEKWAGANFPMTVFALRENGDVVGVTPKSPSLPKDLTGIREIDLGDNLAMALKHDGTVIQWRAAVLLPAEINSVLSGDKPSPFNIRESFYQ